MEEWVKLNGRRPRQRGGFSQWSLEDHEPSKVYIINVVRVARIVVGTGVMEQVMQGYVG